MTIQSYIHDLEHEKPISICKVLCVVVKTILDMYMT